MVPERPFATWTIKVDGLSRWVQRLAGRKHANVAIVALANKLARIAWAMTRRDMPYEHTLAASSV